MGICVTERQEPFQVPFGTKNSEGTPEASFWDLKHHPEWISVLPSSIGWPETQALLQIVNSSSSPFLSLAADQEFTTPTSTASPVLTSFLTFCWFPVTQNTKPRIDQLAGFLVDKIDGVLQQTSNQLQEPLPLKIVIEKQPTVFHLQDYSGWSLSVLMAGQGKTMKQARRIWGVGIQALQDVLDHPTFGSS